MEKRIVAIWFPHLVTDWLFRKKPELKERAFALVSTERGKRVVKAVNDIAKRKGIRINMVAADCKTLVPDLEVQDFEPEQPLKLMKALAEWCIRYTPSVAIEGDDTLILDATGCTHLWEGDAGYLKDIQARFAQLDYHVQVAMADTVGVAWAVSKFGTNGSVITSGKELNALLDLPPMALRLEPAAVERLEKLGLKTISGFIKMPSTALRRRFGQHTLNRIAQALGSALELPENIVPVPPYQERLPSLEPIRTVPGIEIAIRTLLETLCLRLQKESKGLRKCNLQCYRIDGQVLTISIGTSKPTRNTLHLFKLFENKISQLKPGLGIELFVMQATVVEELHSSQDALWTVSGGSEAAIAELLDRIGGRIGGKSIYRFLPSEHYWPERAYTLATSLSEKAGTEWRTDLPRPLHLLAKPELILVSVPLPDYPPILFQYKGVLHTIKKADGPERIEQEWWIEDGLYRDYYCVQDQHGSRYWLFRSGNYDVDDVKWFMHGFFA